MRHKILCIAGARPNFIKIAPMMRALTARPEFNVKLVHTGQHYDDALSKIFFDDLNIPRPDINLSVGSGSHAAQTASIMASFEPVVSREQPHATIVVGDVNSTIACSLVTAKFQLNESFKCSTGVRIRPLVVHVEAGLRSFDNDMPEEINRILTDSISDLLFVSEPAGLINLKREGVSDRRVHFVGNVMIDTLIAAKAQADKSPILETLKLAQRGYALLTLHRPSNVDDPEKLCELLTAIDQIASDLPVLFPVHPRTRPKLSQSGIAKLSESGITDDPARWIICDPIGYLDFMKLLSAAKLVLTDSGGIQEESTVLSVPCLTLRDNTERPVTIDQGTNVLAGTSPESILSAYKAFKASPKIGRVPELWDGKAADRIVAILSDYLTQGT